MNKFNLSTFFLLVALTMSGCGPRMVWVNQDPDRQSAFYIDNGECENQARRLYPSVQLPPPPRSNEQTGTINLYDSNGNYIHGNYNSSRQQTFEERLYEQKVREIYMESGAVEARNDRMRVEAYKQCMGSSGWYQVTQESVSNSRRIDSEFNKEYDKMKNGIYNSTSKKKKKSRHRLNKKILDSDAWWLN